MSGQRWLIVGAVAFSLGAYLPLLALNWQITLANEANVPNPVDVATGLMWGGTAAAAWIGWRGKRWATFGAAGQSQQAGPRFAPRARA
jgi:hypothetical protein